MPSFPFPPWYLSGPNKYQFGVVLSLVSIFVFFAALVLAFALILPDEAVRVHIALPHVLWLSTALIASSSYTLERARHAMRRAWVERYRRLLWATLLLGGCFIACQMYSWHRISVQGIPLQGNPRGFAFYVFTGVHAAHLLGGLLGLWYLLLRISDVDADSEQSLRRYRRLAGAAALYWHSMGVLWAGLFALLYRWSG